MVRVCTIKPQPGVPRNILKVFLIAFITDFGLLRATLLVEFKLSPQNPNPSSGADSLSLPSSPFSRLHQLRFGSRTIRKSPSTGGLLPALAVAMAPLSLTPTPSTLSKRTRSQDRGGETQPSPASGSLQKNGHSPSGDFQKSTQIPNFLSQSKPGE